MDRARLTRIVYRDSYLSSLKRILSSKITTAALAITIVGIALFVFSLQQNVVISSENVQQGVLTVGSGADPEFYFGVPSDIKSNMTFTIPKGQEIQYTLYSVDNYTSNFQYKTSIHQIGQGSAMNSTMIPLTNVYNPQGQEYFIQIHAPMGASYQMHVKVTSTVYIVEPSSSNIGGPAMVLAICGLIILATRVSNVYSVMKGYY